MFSNTKTVTFLLQPKRTTLVSSRALNWKVEWGRSDLGNNCIHRYKDSFQPFFVPNQMWIFRESVEKRDKSLARTFTQHALRRFLGKNQDHGFTT